MNARRSKAEKLIYSFFGALDKTGKNIEYYRNLFHKMNDKEFEKYCKNDLVFRFHERPFEVVPSMNDAISALKTIKVPLLEKVSFPSLYVNSNGVAVESPPCMVVYMHVKKMKQFITKKNSMSTNIDTRDMKTGLLISDDKNGKTSDREIEGMTVMGLDKTCREMTTYKADFMDSKSKAYQTIALKGQLSEKDLDINTYESLSRNMLNAYMISAGLYTNFLNEDYMLPSTIAQKTRKVERV